MQHTYIIPEWNLARLRQDIDKLNKRASKLKVAGISIVISPAYQELEWINPKARKLEPKWFADHDISFNEDNERVVGEPREFMSGECAQLTGRSRQWVYAAVNGETPKFAGWMLTGVLEPLTLDDGTTENLVRTVPGYTVPLVYRNRVGECDHCKTIRRRVETFVVQHEDGRTKMVGRQCLKDFLGHADPHALAKLAELLCELSSLCDSAGNEDWLGGGCYVPNAWTLHYFLTVTSAVIRKEGWLSKTKAREQDRQSTSDHVCYFLNPPFGKEAKAEWERYCDEINAILEDPTHEQAAQAAIDWAKGLEPKDTEDYLYNVNLIARAGFVKDRTVGLSCSMLTAHRRAIEAFEEKKNRPVSEHVGQIGEKVELEVTCHKVISHEGQYGSTGIHKMTDTKGNDFTWFASSATTWLEEGLQYQIKGTVKDHGEYQGRKQTVLTRVKIIKDHAHVHRDA